MSEYKHTATPLDLGSGVTGELRVTECPSGEILRGVAYWHDCPKGHHGGFANLSGPDPWTLEQLDPLTISPSLLCRACGHHGFIRDGKWVPA